MSLTADERDEVMRLVTAGFARRYQAQIAVGMTDDQLRNALAEAFGIFGGFGHLHGYSATYQASGLKVWGAKHVVNHVIETPLCQGQLTVQLVRALYSIDDPSCAQPSLF
jgi:hypothetical protein